MYKILIFFIILLFIVSLVTLWAVVSNNNKVIRTEHYSEIMNNYTFASPIVQKRGTINKLIKNNPNHEEFYNAYTGNSKITTAIVGYALDNEVPIHIAFSLAWNESKYKVTAIGPKNSNGTRDWGLFQLNDGYRQEWTEADFFNINKNVKAGIEYLAYCINQTGSIEKGIGAYNRGVRGISKYGLPKKYISDVLAYEKKLDIELNNYLYN